MAFGNLVNSRIWSLRFIKFQFLIRFINTSGTFRSQGMQFNGLPRTAYFQKRINDNVLTVTLLVEYNPLLFSKTFTFTKQIDSPISSLLSKIDQRVEYYIERKLRRSAINYEVPKVQSTLYKDGGEVSKSCLCSYMFDGEGKFVLNILGDSYVVHRNSPWIINMGLPRKIFSKSHIYPLKFEAQYTQKENSAFKWYRTEQIAAYLKTNILHIKNWTEIGNDYYYEVQDEDVGHYLKFVCMPGNEKEKGPTFIIMSQSPVEASRCDYHFIKTHVNTKEKVDDTKIRIVSYNMLAGEYLTTKEGKIMFDYCPPEILEIDQRYMALTWEVSGYNADVYCLQEVDTKLHNNYMLGKLDSLGYDGILTSKGNRVEGLAFYYNKSKFKLICTENFIYGEEILMNLFPKDFEKYLENKDFFTKFCELPHCFQLVVLQFTPRQDHLLIVGNIHLFSQPNAGFIRFLQLMASIKIYERTVIKLKEMRPNDKISLIFCGDFNSTPDAALNEWITNGSLSPEHPIWNDVGEKGFSVKLPVKLASAFPDVQYTNYTRLFKGCLDYIYYQPDLLELSKTYSLPDEEELSSNVGLPSYHFPSDHLPLIAELQWKT